MDPTLETDGLSCVPVASVLVVIVALAPLIVLAFSGRTFIILVREVDVRTSMGAEPHMLAGST